MRLRSLLFVPGNRPERFARAAASGADAVILDLEDSVPSSARDTARAAVADYMAGPRPVPLLVRINPVTVQADLAAILPLRPDGVVLPKAEGARSVRTLLRLMGKTAVPILPITTETPAGLFCLGTYGRVSRHLLGLTWGAEDLPAAIGATTAREEDGRYTPPYEMVRSMALFAAHAAGAPAIETVFPAIRDEAGLTAYVARARRDGFCGMMALHPAQVPIINQGFTPGPDEIAQARRILAAFAQNPDSGALMLDGQMIDRPHLRQAQRTLGVEEVSHSIGP